MSLNMILPEVHVQTDSIRAMCQAQIESMETIKKSIYRFVLEGELRGKTYDSAKDYFSNVYIPLANGLILLSEAIMQANEDFPKRYVEEVDVNSLYSEVLEQQIQRLNELVQSLEALQITNPIIDLATEAMARNLHALQWEIRRKLDKLRHFDHTSAQIFSEIESIYADVQRGLHEVSSGRAWSRETGTFQKSRLDLTWTHSINERAESSEILKKIAQANKSKDTIFKEHLQQQFGFEAEEIELMLKLRDELKEKFPRAKQHELDWRFTRLLGGFSYGDTGLDAFLWNTTAGDPYAISSSFRLNEKEYFTRFLGFTEAEYSLLRYKVRIQNFIVSNPEEYRWDNIEGLDRTNLEMFRASLERVLDRRLTGKEFEDYWINQYENMVSHGDFAHQQITAATMLDKKLIASNTIENLSGWLGDAGLNDSILGAELSFGTDDYKADLDAENIRHLMETETLSYQTAVNKYYTEVGTLYTRAEMFKEHTSLEEVKKQVYTLLKVSFISVDDANMEKLKKEAPGTYNFLRSLEEDKHEMGNYQ